MTQHIELSDLRCLSHVFYMASPRLSYPAVFRFPFGVEETKWRPANSVAIENAKVVIEFR